MPRQTPGARLTYYRQSMGISLFQLAVSNNLSAIHLRRVEVGTETLTAGDLVNLAKGGLNPVWVQTGVGPMLTGNCDPLQANEEDLLAALRNVAPATIETLLAALQLLTLADSA